MNPAYNLMRVKCVWENHVHYNLAACTLVLTLKSQVNKMSPWLEILAIPEVSSCQMFSLAEVDVDVAGVT